MKITIELESFAIKALLTLLLAAWCAWGGGSDVALTMAALTAMLKA